MADAGRVIAGTARGVRLAGARRRHAAARATGSSRRCSRSSSRTSPAPRSSTCSPAAAPPGSRRCRAARRAAIVRREGPGRGRGRSTRTCGRPALAGPAAVGRPLGRRPLARRAEPSTAPFDLVLVDPPYAETELLAAGPRRSSARPDAPLAPGRPRRRQALLARPTARADRSASGRARPPLRRDGADLLPTPRRSDDDESRSIPARSTRSRTATSTSSAGPRRVFDRVVVGVLANPRKQPLLSADDRVAVIRAALARGRRRRRTGSTVAGVRRADRRLLPRGRAPGSSSAACGRSATSRPRCSSPTTTAGSRPTSTRSSS